jgi:hypothetical protein
VGPLLYTQSITDQNSVALDYILVTLSNTNTTDILVECDPSYNRNMSEVIRSPRRKRVRKQFSNSICFESCLPAMRSSEGCSGQGKNHGTDQMF